MSESTWNTRAYGIQVKSDYPDQKEWRDWEMVEHGQMFKYHCNPDVIKREFDSMHYKFPKRIILREEVLTVSVVFEGDGESVAEFEYSYKPAHLNRDDE